MTPVLVIVRRQASVGGVAELMLMCRIRGVPVVDSKGRFQGIVSEGDLVRRVDTGSQSRRCYG